MGLVMDLLLGDDWKLEEVEMGGSRGKGHGISLGVKKGGGKKKKPGLTAQEARVKIDSQVRGELEKWGRGYFQEGWGEVRGMLPLMVKITP